MKIESTGSTPSSIGEARPRTTASRTNASTASEVHLSELAAQLQGAGDELSFDVTRVAEIKQAVAEGRFSINVQAIADRLISSASQLLDPQRQG